MISKEKQKKPVVIVAGATGFVGQALLKELSSRYQMVGLTRSAVKKNNPQQNNIQWQQCDLFSRQETAQAMVGADYAFYLVHSMMPSARLTQGSFYDMDLILADNFAQTAAMMGLKQIIYLGGLIPPNQQLSWHLNSRLEVEETLGSYGVPVTALRAGLIVGANGSTFQIVADLVKRFKKALFLPKMLGTTTHPIALEDILKLLDYCLGNPETFGQSFDVGGPETMTYREMIVKVSQVMGHQPKVFDLPIRSTKLTGWLLSKLTGSPKELVAPLVESLSNPMIAQDTRLQKMAHIPGLSFTKAAKRALRYEQKHRESIRVPRDMKKRAKSAPTVRSVQRIPLPVGLDACWLSRNYATWLARFFHSIIHVHVNSNGDCFFYLFFPRLLLLELTYVDAQSSNDRPIYHITGGLLNRDNQLQRPGRLEFRTVLHEQHALVAIHDYSPTLPWFIYNLTQARLHLWVMQHFSQYLECIKHSPPKCDLNDINAT